jgi:hypothetical protein
MTAFKKTILGKILGVAAKVVLPVVGLVTGIGAISGAAKGIGVVAGIGATVKKVTGGVSAVAQKAIDLVTGDTAEERAAIKAQKAITDAGAQKIDFANKLIQAGATKEAAYKQAGIVAEEAPGVSGLPTQTASVVKPFLIGGAILTGLYLLAKAVKIIK